MLSLVISAMFLFGDGGTQAVYPNQYTYYSYKITMTDTGMYYGEGLGIEKGHGVAFSEDFVKGNKEIHIGDKVTAAYDFKTEGLSDTLMFVEKN